MHKFSFYLLLLCLCAAANAQTETIPFDKAYKRVYQISRATGAKPAIDGRLDEPFWEEQGLWSEPFVQVTPYERAPSASPTKAKLLYDDTHIYIGIYCKDAEPERMNRFVNNRDANGIGDLVSVAFDTYHDFRAAPEFNVNSGGNRTDLIVTDRLDVNLSWNAVWESATQVDLADSSWTAEIRIPFSRLRYNWKSGDGIWGLHIRRIIRRNNEVQNWSMIPLKNNGHVFSFGEMHGMDSLPRPRSMDFRPYLMGRNHAAPSIAGSPYGGSPARSLNAGLDARFALSDFTLDLTVNPDFGQVELDPSVMNLTAYETFYDEKRPFFLEGKHILDFGNGSDMMFYSRRIGSAPSSPVRGLNGTDVFAEEKGNVPIIGAMKLTGTNRNGITIGLLQSVTARLSTRVSRVGTESLETLEAPASYTVARVQKNRNGNTLVGGMITSVNRFFSGEPVLETLLPANAYTAGIDFTQYFNNRLYYIDAKAMLSSVKGSAEAIARLQSNPVHYFQRESAAGYVGIDPARTSLVGTGGYLKAGRRGNSRFTFAETFEWASPGFDLNDAGYLRQADLKSNLSALEFRQTDVWRIFRSNRITLTQKNQWDYGGSAINNYAGLEWQSMLLNRYEIVLNETYAWHQLDSRLLRGGPDMRYNPAFITDLTFNTDKARRLVFAFNWTGRRHLGQVRSYNTLAPSLNLRLGNHILLAGQFSYASNDDELQYVGVLGSDYLMGRMKQRTYGATLRLQANITPDISIQCYASPFTSTATFSDFKLAADTRADAYSDRFRSIAVDHNSGEYAWDGGSFADPDFRFNEFRSNIVGRWEYLPGSTLYLVWEHRRSQRTGGYAADWGDNLERMFGLPSVNTLMLKINYWFDL
ncbi:MAG: carbohydrate binding family 9 domain-containing protein [Tannerellaceae bacterium]|jgi:hypothetical protein|nr:carbohydrate binding family 9 domain-containing protein [Tannerellaceae bacterium]